MTAGAFAAALRRWRRSIDAAAIAVARARDDPELERALRPFAPTLWGGGRGRKAARRNRDR